MFPTSSCFVMTSKQSCQFCKQLCLLSVSYLLVLEAYNGKLSREKTFTGVATKGLWGIVTICESFLCEIGWHGVLLWQHQWAQSAKVFSAKMLFPPNRESFLPRIYSIPSLFCLNLALRASHELLPTYQGQCCILNVLRRVMLLLCYQYFNKNMYGNFTKSFEVRLVKLNVAVHHLPRLAPRACLIYMYMPSVST